jgi:hypothetical protein
MFGFRENIRVFHFDAIIVSVIIFFGLLTYNNPYRKTADQNRSHVPIFMTVSQNSAVTSPCIRLQVFQKTWISNKDNFNLLAFNRNPLSESKKTDIKVSHLKSIRENSHRILSFLLRYHLFPPENGEPPSLS